MSRNLCIDLRREWQRRSETAENWGIINIAEPKNELAILQLEREVEIHQRIAALPPPLRESFVFHVVQEIPVKRIASQLGLSPVNVRKRVQLARARLRGDLEDSRAGEGNPAGEPPRIARIVSAGETAPRRFAEAAELFPAVVVIRTVGVKLACGVEQLFHVYATKTPFAAARKIRSLRKRLWQHADDWRNRLELGDLLHSEGEWQQAIDEWQNALALTPHLPAALKLGETLLKLGQAGAAATVFESIRKQNRLSAATGRHLDGWIAFCEKDADRSVRGFQAAADLEPENPVHCHRLALALQLAGRTPEALLAIRRALKLNPNDLVALSLGHEMLLAAGEMEEAVRRAQHLLKLAPLDLLTLRQLVECRCQLGLALGAAGRETKRLLLCASRRSQNPLLIREALAAFFLSQGETKKALAVHGKFFERHPQCPLGRRNYSELLASAGCADVLPTESSVGKLPAAKGCDVACQWRAKAAPFLI
jgi:tetratricopeptide (TPR) repeat protein